MILHYIQKPILGAAATELVSVERVILHYSTSVETNHGFHRDHPIG